MNRTNADRIVELLRERPGLDDDEICKVVGMKPRQQVNQICRRLEDRGVLLRRIGTSGKIVNFVLNASDGPSLKYPITQAGDVRTETRRKPGLPTAKKAEGPAAFPTLDFAELRSTLIIIPCSKRKQTLESASTKGLSILDSLPSNLATRLGDARAAVRGRAQRDEQTMVPAWERYGGAFYGAAHEHLARALKDGLHVVILSGGYGLLLANEPIGDYEARFNPAWWPKDLLEEILVAYAVKHRLGHVRAIVSLTTTYRKVVERVPWRAAGVSDAWLLAPVAINGGAQLKSPRAQGEAFGALIVGSLTSRWRSSDGLRLSAENLIT